MFVWVEAILIVITYIALLYNFVTWYYRLLLGLRRRRQSFYGLVGNAKKRLSCGVDYRYSLVNSKC